ELGATAPRDAAAREDGSVPIATLLESVLGEMLEEGLVTDAVLAATEAQRAALWARREAAAEIGTPLQGPMVDTDICVPVDKVAAFLERVQPRIAAIDPQGLSHCVAHLGDGNVHFAVFPGSADTAAHDALFTAIEDVVEELGGSFSAEHGIGLSKLPAMRRHKDPVA